MAAKATIGQDVVARPSGRSRAKSRTTDGRGRRVLLWAVGLFFAIQFGAGILVDYVWPGLRSPTVGLHFRLMESAAKKPDVLFLGSRRFCMGINAATVNEDLQAAGTPGPRVAFNAGVEAGDLVTADYMLRELARRGAHPRQVVVEISPETVTSHNRWIIEHIRRQITWKDVPAFLGDVCQQGQLKRLLQARFVPLYVHRHQILKQAGALANLSGRAATRSEPATGGKPPTSVAATRDSAGNRTLRGLGEVTDWLRDYEVGGGASEAALERILKRCGKRGIKVLLVGVPVASAHRRLYTPAIEAQFQEYVDRFVSAYGCEFVDFRARVPDNLFSDHHHLSAAGSVYFSRELTKELLAAR